MRRLLAAAAILGATLVFCGTSSRQPQTPHHTFTVAARRYAFEPATLEVHQGDLVQITLRTQDIAHSFVIDALRVARRATGDRAVTFEMFVEQAGVFPFYCNLTLEDGCREMRGRLVVAPAADRTSAPSASAGEDSPGPGNTPRPRRSIPRPHRAPRAKYAVWPAPATASGLLFDSSTPAIGGRPR